MHSWLQGLAIVVSAFALATPAFAQGGGASSTGTIQGRVTDAQGAVLPGVTVTASSPSMLGQQTSVTSETGNYRFPAVPPGTYTLSYELAGFSTVRREGIEITLGFTATVNTELALATLQETVTVTGESPLIDTTATRVQQNFKLDQLQSIPNSRDMWALLAVTPAVTMSRIDVGGNRAGTQTDYTAYGFNGQVRVLIEGINTTEGTDGAGFYFDYSSLEEVFMGTSGQSAEMPNPGVQSQFIAKSGGNSFSGEYYLDWYNNTLQGSNIPQAVIDRGIRPHSNEIQGYYDTSIQAGGPITRDKIWWFATYKDQENKIEQPLFTFDQTFDTRLWNPVVKGTYQLNQQHKLIGYYQWGQKIQASRLPVANYTYSDFGQTFRQDSGSWVWKAEWNGTLTDRLYIEARYGDFGYYFPQIANSDRGFWWRDTGLQIVDGSPQRQQSDRDRKQITSAATYFLDTAKGTHTLKIGGELLLESQWSGFLEGRGGNRDLQYTNGRSNQIAFYFPTAINSVGSLSTNDDGNTLSINKLNVAGAFVNDTWSLGRFTVNAGVRWDRYRNWLPDQRQVAYSHGTPLLTIQDQSFPEQELNVWNSFAPRVGMVFDLSGDGKTVVKANYGLFWHNPGPALSSDLNQNQSTKTLTLVWNDLNGDRRWQPGEEGNVTTNNLAGSRQKAADLKQPYTHEVGVFFERQLAQTIGSRVGFVYKTEDDLLDSYQLYRPPSVYSVPFPFTDIGRDGRSGTEDDRVITLYGMPRAIEAQHPLTEVIMNAGELGRYKTMEASVSKRYSHRWSAALGGSYTWRDNYPNDTPTGFPQTPNHPGRYDRTTWDFKMSGSYDAPWGIRVSPVLRHQSGTNYAREISVPASAATPFGLIIPGTTYYADDPENNRRDRIWLLDLKAEKTIPLGADMRVRGFVDLFNITNSHAADEITRTTGANFQRPTSILPPRTLRLGFRFVW